MSTRDIDRVRQSQEVLRSSFDQPAIANDADFSAQGPGPKTWLGLVLGVLWFNLFGLVGVVLAVLSRRKGRAAQRLWQSGDRAQADALASSAAKLRRAALTVGFFAPLCLVALAIVVLTLFGEPAADQFTVIE